MDEFRWHGPTLVVGADADVPTDLLRELPVEPQRCTVLVLEPTIANPGSLERILDACLPREITSVRLALPQAGATRFTQRLADRLDIEVIAPDGPVVLLPPGVLFVTSPVRGGRVGGWWSHRPHQPSQRQGPHHPAPAWAIQLPERRRFRRAALLAHAVPCGIWLRPRARKPQALDDPAFAVPVDPRRTTVLIGCPGSPPIPFKVLHSWLAALPRATLERLTLMPYGQTEHSLDAVAEKLSEDFLVTVERTAGVPTFGADATSTYALVDNDGRPRARRIIQRVSYHSASLHDVDAWLNPLTRTMETDRVSVPVGPHWVIDAVRCGLWFHKADARDTHNIAARPADTHTETIVVDVDGDLEGVAMARWAAAGLPDDIAANLRWEILAPLDGDNPDAGATDSGDRT